MGTKWIGEDGIQREKSLATRKAFKRKRVREIPAARKSARKAAPPMRELATKKSAPPMREIPAAKKSARPMREIPAARKSARKSARPMREIPAVRKLARESARPMREKLAAKKSAPLSAPSQSLHGNPHTDATEIISNHVEMTLFRDVGYQCMISLLDLFVVIVVMILSLWLLMGTRDS